VNRCALPKGPQDTQARPGKLQKTSNNAKDLLQARSTLRKFNHSTAQPGADKPYAGALIFWEVAIGTSAETTEASVQLRLGALNPAPRDPHYFRITRTSSTLANLGPFRKGRVELFSFDRPDQRAPSLESRTTLKPAVRSVT